MWDWELGRDVEARCGCNDYATGPMVPQFPGMPAASTLTAHGWSAGATMHRVVPAAGAHCGFYAYDRAATLEYYLQAQSLAESPAIRGVILVWGRIEVGPVVDHRGVLQEPGYRLRAQYARVVALEKDHPRLDQLPDQAGLALVAKPYLEAWATEYAGDRYRLEERFEGRQE
jgi:hypothetical protein